MTAPFLSKGHVNFGLENYLTRENSIVVQESAVGVVDIHLGFLQYHHRYNVTVEIPKLYFMGYDLQSVVKSAENSEPNINCRVISITDEGDYFVFFVEFFAEKERLVREELILNFGNSTSLKLQFNARVLGPGKGTPLLKNGIRRIGIIQDDVSEASDWQG